MVLEDEGIDPDRFTLEWVSSAEAPRFAELVTDFVDKIKTKGPHSDIASQAEMAALPN